MTKVGVVGLGVIGRAVCRALDRGIDGLTLAGGTARDRARGAAFLDALSGPVPYLSLDRLVATCDLLVEASTQSHLAAWAADALGRGRQVMMLSGGALLDHPEWIDLARAHGGRILVPSGAIGGLDAVKAARVGAVASVTMETRKPPQALAGAPGVVAAAIDLDALTAPTLLFEGPAREAVRAFPANVNVVAALALAGIGPDRTRLRLYAVPGLARNVHRITVEGEAGRVSIEVENVPSENPRTGRLSALSAIAMLRDLHAPLRVGT